MRSYKSRLTDETLPFIHRHCGAAPNGKPRQSLSIEIQTSIYKVKWFSVRDCFVPRNDGLSKIDVDCFSGRNCFVTGNDGLLKLD